MSRGSRDVDLGLVLPRSMAARARSALEALALGRDAEARQVLAALIDAAGSDDGVEIAEAELDAAFAEAEPEAAEMRDANQLAYDAIRAAALDAPEGVVTAAPDSPFQTRTMAALLERQGDTAGARSIRSALAQREPRELAPTTRGDRRRADSIRILEHWLERTRRGDA